MAEAANTLDKPDQSGQPRDGGRIIVGIGASAGGLAALKTFFANTPANSGLSFVVVVHLSPDHESLLPQLLQPHASIPVTQVTETIPIEPNTVYIIPPRAYLGAIDTHLRLSEPADKRHARGPIDHFFRTLAQTHGSHAIGVVLTGTGSDGTLGIKAIKESGGMVMVQDPEEAEYDGMPRSALATGLVDRVLPVNQLPVEIVRITRIKPLLDMNEDGGPEESKERELLEKIFAQVRSRTHRDFSRYKSSTSMRRIRRRMQLNQVESLAEYLKILREQPDEVYALADEFLITVTNFFRDPEVYATLEKTIVPQMLAGKTQADTLRAWSAGCSTGEEAYSLTILLLEAMSRQDSPPELQVFASDLHEASLKIAREAVYTGLIEADVSPERLKRFFTKSDSGYLVRKEVRERLVFAQHNVLADPPFSKLDLIVCRNLLIYLDRPVQREVIALFHYALNPDGVLVLGRAESIEESSLFRTEDKTQGIYRKLNTAVREPRLPVFSGVGRRFTQGGETPPVTVRPAGAFGALHYEMVERYALPSILIDEDHKVVHVSAQAARYLRIPAGEPSAGLFNMVLDEFRVELFAAVQEAERTRTAVRTRPVRLHIEGTNREVVADVRPAEAGGDMQGFSLIMFDERPGVPHLSDDTRGRAEGEAQNRELQTQLDIAHERMRGIIEEYEVSQEEMKVANEELQSSNEELRSTLEELETSREELQSINEELSTVNQENRLKVEELNQLTSDLQNLMVATDIPALFLDRELRVVRFTPRVRELFNVRDSDRGRPVTDLTHRLDYPTLISDARQVLARHVPVETEVQDSASRWFFVRILPYWSSGERIGGVVATFVDITAQRRGVQEVLEAKKQAEDVVDTIDEPLLILTPEMRVKSANEAFYAHFRSTPAQIEGKPIYALGNGQWDNPQLRSLLEDVLPKGTKFSDHEISHHFDDIGDRVILVSGRRLAHSDLILLGFRDITDLKRVETALREADRRKDEFLAMLAHELRNPLAAICNGLAVQKLSGTGDAVASLTHEMLERQAKQLVRLVDDLLDVSRITRGKVELRKERIDLATVVSSALAICAPLIEAAGCSLTVEAMSDSLIVDADAVRMTQIISNLLNNATKYTPDGGRITVNLSRDGDMGIISVRDTGVGIAADSLPRIFDLFVQVDNPTAKAQGGLGIGLTLVRNLVELHGGRIEARSEGLGRGSEFIVRLPLAPGLDPQQGKTAADSKPGLPAPTRVLVVDDNRDSADSLAILLRLQGHDVRVAYDGPAALQSIAQDRPQLALVDVGMPGMDGFEVARNVRGDPAFNDIKLVAVTGWGQEKDRKASAAAGFDHHLMKPISLDSLAPFFAPNP
jgi:two-component system CheB/CheR fusion protein